MVRSRAIHGAMNKTVASYYDVCRKIGMSRDLAYYMSSV